MGRRYSRIRQAPRLQAAQTAYLTYQGTYRPPNLNSQGARGTTATAYFHPFGVAFVGTEVYSAKVNPQHYSVLAPLIQGTAEADVGDTLGTDTLITESGFRAARVIWFRNNTRVVSTPTSAVTNQEYLKYEGERLSCPFGAAAGTDNLADAFGAIKAACLAVTGFEVSRVSLSRERVPV